MLKFLQKCKDKFRRNWPEALVGVLIVLFLLIFFSEYMFITVGAGQGAVLFKRFYGGTVVDRVFGEGIHAIFPWDKMTIYNLRVQQVTHEFNVLTKNGLGINLNISIRFHPQPAMLGVLHKLVGPDYTNKVVIPEIEHVLRVIIGRLGANEVYSTKTESSPLEKALIEGIEQVGQKFINIDDVIIKRVKLPQQVELAIHFKLEQKHMAQAYEFILQKEAKEAERKRIEAQGIKDHNDTINSSLSASVLKWKGIQATLDLSRSRNAKVVVIGSGKEGLPIIGNLPLDSHVDTPDQTPTAPTDSTPSVSPTDNPAKDSAFPDPENRTDLENSTGLESPPDGGPEIGAPDLTAKPTSDKPSGLPHGEK